MKIISLSGKRGKNKSTIVDDSTFKKYGHLSWYLSDTGYAVRKTNEGFMRLHRLVAETPEGMVTDHLNGDKLDNRKSNLRVCTQKDNVRNRKGTKGYSWDKNKQKWIVRYRRKFYGRYATKEEAIEAYKLACSGVEYNKTRRKYYMLPRHITKQFGKYRFGIQIDGKRYRKVGIDTLEEAISIRDKYLEDRG